MESGHCRIRGLLTLGSDSGNDVKRKRLVVGDDVSTLSDSKVVSSKAVVAVVPVLYHFDNDFFVDVKAEGSFVERVGVWGLGDFVGFDVKTFCFCRLVCN
jgi:hypothetical protein